MWWRKRARQLQEQAEHLEAQTRCGVMYGHRFLFWSAQQWGLHFTFRCQNCGLTYDRLGSSLTVEERVLIQNTLKRVGEESAHGS